MMVGVTEQLSPSAIRCAHEVRIAISRLRRRLRETYDRRDLTPSQTSVLSRLDKHGPMSASQLASAERVRPQSVAATLTVLEERSMIERRPDPDDKRSQRVFLSTEGRALLTASRHDSEQWLARALNDELNESERATIVQAMSLLDRVVDR